MRQFISRFLIDFCRPPSLALLTAALALAPALSPAKESPRDDRARIAAIDDAGPMLNAVIALAPPDAARAASGPLAGLTVLVKDNIETRDMPTTAGSLALKGNFTGRDAPLLARVRAAGGIILGKTNLSEWANFRSNRASSGWSAAGGQTKNPHALDRSPCGSSSGSAAAVAADLSWAAIGTETDGSITCPASMNGVVGFKPTVGLVSRTFIVPISTTQDTAGPMARTVSDAARLLTAMAGPDPADTATADAASHAVDFGKALTGATLKGLRIGVMRKQVGDLPGVRSLFEAAVADMRGAGAEIVDIDFTMPDGLSEAEFAVLLYEFRTGIDAYLAHLPGNPPIRSLADMIAFEKDHPDTEMRWSGHEVFELAMKATDEQAYRKARETAHRLAGTEGIDALLRAKRVDVLVSPTEGPAWPIDPVLGDHFTEVGIGRLAAIAGYPHLTVPMGAVEGLPIGLSFIAGKWADARVLKAGKAYESVRRAGLAAPSFRRWGE